MSKQTYIIFTFIFLLFIQLSIAVEYPQPYDFYVNDYAQIFNQEEILYLENTLEETRLNTTAEIVVVTINSLNGSDISQYTIELANQWKVGKSDNDNGLVILYAKEENKIFVATGYGLEGILPDSKIGRILDTYYVPLRDEGNVSLGIIVTTYQLCLELILNSEEIRSNNLERQNEQVPFMIFFVLGFFLLIGILIYFGQGRRNRGVGDFMTFFFIDFMIRMIILSTLSRGGRGSVGGSFGGGGFGGGSFGGGGAGR